MLSEGAKYLMGLAKGGSYSTARDALKHRIYDSRVFAATATDATMFLQPIGAPWRIGTKTLTETNMRSAGQLPNGQVMMFTRMGIQMISFMTGAGTNPEVLAQSFINMMHSSVFEVKIEGREWDYQIHGSEFMPALAVNGNTGATNIAHRVGDFQASGWSRLDPTPIVLDQLISFSVIHRFANPDTNIQTVINAAATALNTANSVLKVTLEGMLTRAK